ncbi:FAD-dependent oxidoreductase [Ornithinimicrobium panacihumi]|uniref:FAD-dependent oxidoreductase n=1 Tax=Ornithinimicrobium panacihumi TaxID=2008449 RepID=UPI003F8C4CB7
MTDMTSLWQATSTMPSTDPWQDGLSCEVVVVGSGITGLATAHELARRGVDVVVLEARELGGVTTARTTAKVSLLQGGTLSAVRRGAGAEGVTAYLEANRAGQDWWREVVGVGPDLQVRDAVTYSSTAEGKERMLAEWEASREAGLPVEVVGAEALGYGVPVTAALRLPDQLQTHPLRALSALAEGLRAQGVRIMEGVRVSGVSLGSPSEVRTDHGPLLARQVVLATGTPVLDRRAHFARLSPQRSYALSYRVPGAPPSPMCLSLDPETRSVRSVPVDGEDFLLVGGNGHVVGREGSEQQRIDDLDAWARATFPGAQRVHTWSAQDYRSEDALPIVGPLAGEDTRLLVATGFGKWGMTNGAAAGLALASWVVGDEPTGWMRALAQHRPSLAAAASLAKINGTVAGWLARGLAAGAARALPDQAPAEGEGVVGRDGARVVACSTVDGATRRVSGHCTHLGAVLEWNDAERSWDCPLHGSRFAPDGAVLEGPATSPLPPA